MSEGVRCAMNKRRKPTKFEKEYMETYGWEYDNAFGNWSRCQQSTGQISAGLCLLLTAFVGSLKQHKSIVITYILVQNVDW